LTRLFDERMKETFDKVWIAFEKQKRQYDIRTIAYLIAIKRIIDAEKLRGRI